jgi:5-methylcytosine-specific restriction endonuclease McrA
MAYKDPIKQREFQRNWQAKQRAKYKEIVLDIFGRACITCGFTNVLALQLDHIIPLKRPDYSTRGSDTGTGLWRKVATGTIPKKDIQLLCANCHSIKTYNDNHHFEL